MAPQWLPGKDVLGFCSKMEKFLSKPSLSGAGSDKVRALAVPTDSSFYGLCHSACNTLVGFTGCFGAGCLQGLGWPLLTLSFFSFVIDMLLKKERCCE